MLNLIYIVQIIVDSWYCSGLEIRNLRALISTVSNDNRKRRAQNVPYLQTWHSTCPYLSPTLFFSYAVLIFYIHNKAPRVSDANFCKQSRDDEPAIAV